MFHGVNNLGNLFMSCLVVTKMKHLKLPTSCRCIYKSDMDPERPLHFLMTSFVVFFFTPNEPIAIEKYASQMLRNSISAHQKLKFSWQRTPKPPAVALRLQCLLLSLWRTVCTPLLIILNPCPQLVKSMHCKLNSAQRTATSYECSM